MLQQAEKKIPITLYIDKETDEKLYQYCLLTRRNRVRIFNEALEEYLNTRIRKEYKNQGMLQ